jgi:acyl carrier protein
MTNTESTIRQVVAEHGRLAVDVATLDDHASLYAAGLTSHASVNVMLALEDAFEVVVPERFQRRSTFETFASLLVALDSLVSVN